MDKHSFFRVDKTVHGVGLCTERKWMHGSSSASVPPQHFGIIFHRIVPRCSSKKMFIYSLSFRARVTKMWVTRRASCESEKRWKFSGTDLSRIKIGRPSRLNWLFLGDVSLRDSIWIKCRHSDIRECDKKWINLFECLPFQGLRESANNKERGTSREVHAKRKKREMKVDFLPEGDPNLGTSICQEVNV